jgi:FAD/FMN-containing dehydrogenase
VAVRGGGHNVAGLAGADQAVTIDLSRMRDVHVDPGLRRVRVEAGALLGDVDRATQAFQLVVPTGVVSAG